MTVPPSEQPDFIAQQRAFTDHIRDPEQHPRPGQVEDRRMAIYRELFFNNVEGFVSTAFPVLRTITAEDVWLRRVRDFFAEHRCETPYFAEIAEEFLAWLQHERGDHPDDPAFIQELAHYEWVELALSVSDADADENLPALDRNGDLLAARPMISPLAWHLAYSYPVHRIGPDFQPEHAGEQPTFLTVYRDRDDQIHFLELNAVTYRLLDLLKENPAYTGLDAMKVIAAEMQHPQPELVVEHGQQLLNDLRNRNIIIGTRLD